MMKGLFTHKQTHAGAKIRHEDDDQSVCQVSPFTVKVMTQLTLSQLHSIDLITHGQEDRAS